MFLGPSITSHGKPKVGVLCTVLTGLSYPRTTLSKQYIKRPTLGLCCEVINEPRNIWSFVPCSGGIALQLLLVEIKIKKINAYA